MLSTRQKDEEHTIRSFLKLSTINKQSYGAALCISSSYRPIFRVFLGSFVPPQNLCFRRPQTSSHDLIDDHAQCIRSSNTHSLPQRRKRHGLRGYTVLPFMLASNSFSYVCDTISPPPTFSPRLKNVIPRVSRRR